MYLIIPKGNREGFNTQEEALTQAKTYFENKQRKAKRGSLSPSDGYFIVQVVRVVEPATPPITDREPTPSDFHAHDFRQAAPEDDEDA